MKPTALRIAAAQLDYTLNDFEGNLDRMRAAVAVAPDADLLVFSELSLSGYHPLDLLDEPDFPVRQQAAIDALRALSRETPAALVVGAALPNDGPGKAYHNSLLVFQDGEVRLTYHKQLLPDYDIFDERRHFEPGPRQTAVLTLKGARIGFLICEDAWNVGGNAYPVDPVADVVRGDIGLLVVINASPSNVGKREQRHAALARAARAHWLPVLYVNQVGGNDQIVFDGHSFLMAPDGSVSHEAPGFAEVLLRAEFQDGQLRPVEGGWRVGAETLSDPEFYRRQILLGLRDYLAKTGFERVVVGSSGGIDSALTLALAVEALGPERVTAVTLPGPYSSAGSVDDSETLCRNLGCRLYRHPIVPAYEQLVADYARAFGTPAAGLTRENMQARLRGLVLMAYSNQNGALLLTTGNKSEMSVGYSTLYGDMAGGLNLIGDLYKMEVYALSAHLNARAGRELIPRAILDKAPSAELAPDQKDSDSLPPYPLLDAILMLHIEGNRLRPEEAAAAQAQVEAARRAGQDGVEARVRRMVAGAEFKRRQAPPIIRLRPRAFGNGRQMPITARHRPRGGQP